MADILSSQQILQQLSTGASSKTPSTSLSQSQATQLQTLISQSVAVELPPAVARAIAAGREAVQRLEAIVQQVQNTANQPSTVTLSAKGGSVTLEVPPQLANALNQGGRYSLEFKPGTPPVLSKITLINNPVTQGQTPVLPSTTQAVGPLNNIASTQGFVEAVLLNTNNPNIVQTRQALSPFIQNPSNAINAQSNLIVQIVPGTAQTTALNSVTMNTQKGVLQINATATQNTPILQGTIVGSNNQGLPILQLNAGQIVNGLTLTANQPSLMVLSDASLTVGSTVNIRLIPSAETSIINTPLVNSSMPLTSAPLLPGMSSLSGLDELLAMLLPNSMTAASIGNAMPQAPLLNGNLPSNMLFLMAALQGGSSVGGWLGQAMNGKLAKDSPSLLSKLDTGFKGLKKAMTETRSGLEFRSFSLPLITDQQIQPIQILVRNPEHQQHENEAGQQSDSQKDKKKINDIRFLVNVTMSKLGLVQIDGLYQEKVMNMMVRLETALPRETQLEIKDGYMNVLETLGLVGTLGFQGKTDWVYFKEANTL